MLKKAVLPLLLVTLLISSWSAGAKECHEILKETPQNYYLTVKAQMEKPSGKLSDLVAFRANILRNFKEDQAFFQTNTLREFLILFRDTYQKIENYNELLALFEFISHFSKTPQGRVLFKTKRGIDMAEQLGITLFSKNMAPILLILKSQIEPWQAERLMDALLDNPVLYLKGQNLDSTLKAQWWKLVWLHLIAFMPEVALNEIYLLFHGNLIGMDGVQGMQAAKITDPRVRDGNVDALFRQSPDIVDLVISAPLALRQKYQDLFRLQFYINGKSPKPLTFLVKLFYDSLRSLVSQFQSLSNRGKISEAQIVREIDKYWRENGVLDAPQLGGVLPRGGYSFKEVLKVAKVIQKEINQLGGLSFFRPKVLIYGSFVNGMAHLQSNGRGQIETRSDIDMSFRIPSHFTKQDLADTAHGGKWIQSRNTDHPLFRFLQNTENNIAQALNISGHIPGSLISPKGDYTTADVLAYHQLYNGTYILNASPLALEITGNKLTMIVAVMMPGDLGPKNYSFQIVP